MLPLAYCTPPELFTRLVGSGDGQPVAGHEKRLIEPVWFFGLAVLRVMFAPPLPMPPLPFSVTTVSTLPEILPAAPWVTSLAEAELVASPAVMIVTLPVPAAIGAFSVT